MDDLIYSFLLQYGFPRASIVVDVDLLGPTAQVGSGMNIPTFVLVDPDNADPLAVIEVVDAVNPERLKQAAIETGAYASRLAGKFVQGFVIRVDPHGRSEAEQVQFYRIWPNSTLQSLAAKNFPDLESLRVSRKLVVNTTAREVSSASSIIKPSSDDDFKDRDDESEDASSQIPAAGLYVPALVLLLLILLDGLFSAFKGQALLTISQSILALGAAALFTVPAAIRYLRHL